MYEESSKIVHINVNDILPNMNQPRIQFDEEKILELSDSIKEHGVIQPLVVRPRGNKYEIIAGERRYKASVLAGKETVPAIIKNLNDNESAEIALIENIQRKNLTPLEEALSYKRILDMGYLTQEALAEKLGKSQPAIANKIRLLNLSDEVQEALLEEKISERHARSLLRLQTSKEQNEMLNRIVGERLTVRKTDEEIDKIKNNDYIKTTETKEKGDKYMFNNYESMNNNTQPSVSPYPNFGVPNMDSMNQTQSSVVNTPSFDMFAEPSVTNATPSPSTGYDVPSFDIFAPTATNDINNFSTSTKVDNNFSFPEINMETPAPSDQTNTQIEPLFPSFGMPASNLTPNVNDVIRESNKPQQSTSSGLDQFSFNSGINTENSTTSSFDGPSFSVPTSENLFERPENISSNNTFVDNSFTPSFDTFSTPDTKPQVDTNFTFPEFNSAPIVEEPLNNTQMYQQSENLFSFGNDNINSPKDADLLAPQFTQPEVTKMPDPIIVTDYTKQYDPVMPEQVIKPQTKVDFKEVISAIRECSSKIEKYGYKIDVDEYDLMNMYQVILKIEK